MTATISSWQAIKIVGKGGSSVVFKARINDNGHIVAVKQIDTDGLTKDQISSLKGEIETIKELHHPNIISYYGTQQALNKINIFLEYADRGSLRQFYQKKGSMSESQVINCTRQILNGLQYLHEKGIAHRDIKCANCLLTQKGVVKLADFGASKRLESESLVSGLKGTPNWMAPEVIKGTQMTSGWMKADVWSVGCTMIEMLTRNMPFAEYDNPMTAMYHIANGKAPNLDTITCSGQMKDFIKLCCEPNPSSRPSVASLLSHPLLLKKTTSSPSPLKEMSSQHDVISSVPFSEYHLNSRDNSINSNIDIENADGSDEVHEELEVQEYTKTFVDEVESVEDETEIVEQESVPIIYSEESSHISDTNISFLSEVNQQTPPRDKPFPPKESSSPATSATQSNSGSLTESSSSRKSFPRPFRISDQLSKVSSTKLSSAATSSSMSFYGGHPIIQYSQSAPSSRVNTATGSLELSPRAKSRLAQESSSTVEKVSDQLQGITGDFQCGNLEASPIISPVRENSDYIYSTNVEHVHVDKF